MSKYRIVKRPTYYVIEKRNFLFQWEYVEGSACYTMEEVKELFKIVLKFNTLNEVIDEATN